MLPRARQAAHFPRCRCRARQNESLQLLEEQCENPLGRIRLIGTTFVGQNLDDALLTEASAVAGIDQPSQLIHFALRALIGQSSPRSQPKRKPQRPFVITGPFAESNPAVCRDRTASDLIAELDDESHLELREQSAQGDTL